MSCAAPLYASLKPLSALPVGCESLSLRGVEFEQKTWLASSVVA